MNILSHYHGYPSFFPPNFSKSRKENKKIKNEEGVVWGRLIFMQTDNFRNSNKVSLGRVWSNPKLVPPKKFEPRPRSAPPTPFCFRNSMGLTHLDPPAHLYFYFTKFHFKNKI